MKEFKSRRDAAFEEIANSSIITQVKTALLMCNSIDVILRNADRRMRATYNKYGLNVKPSGGDILTGMANYCRQVRNACYAFEKDIEPHIVRSTYDSYGVDSYDWFRASANEVAQLVLKTTDRCNGQNNDNLEKVFAFLDSLPSQGLFSDEDIKRFTLK